MARVVIERYLYTHIFVGKTFETDFGAWLYNVRCLFIKISVCGSQVIVEAELNGPAETGGGPGRVRQTLFFSASVQHMSWGTRNAHTSSVFLCCCRTNERKQLWSGHELLERIVKKRVFVF